MATPPTTVPPNIPKEGEAMMAGFLAAMGQNNYSAKDDPPVASAGYWDYDESTASRYYVNYYSEKPLSKATLEFYEMDDKELKRFQELAFQAGYYGPSAERGDIPWGSYDEDTFKVWATLNQRASNLYKVGKKNTVWDILADDVKNRPENANKNKSRAPLVTQLPDPREIEELIRGVAPSVIGRDADPQFIADFTSMYSKIISEFQANKYALEESGGGTITAPPSAEALAAFRLRHENPEQYEEKRAAGRQAAYTSLLKGAL